MALITSDCRQSTKKGSAWGSSKATAAKDKSSKDKSSNKDKASGRAGGKADATPSVAQLAKRMEAKKKAALREEAAIKKKEQVRHGLTVAATPLGYSPLLQL